MTRTASVQCEIQVSEEPCEVSDLQASCTGESTGKKYHSNYPKVR